MQWSIKAPSHLLHLSHLVVWPHLRGEKPHNCREKQNWGMARNTYVLITKSLLVSVFLLSQAKLCLYCMQTFFKRQKNNANDNCVWLLTKCVFNFGFENNHVESNSFQPEFVLKFSWRLAHNSRSIIKSLSCYLLPNILYHNSKTKAGFVHL